tara:strand:+ start:5973 stop:8240 length:2268 start_codon:yes stop_codon:yes gene_type:complete
LIKILNIMLNKIKIFKLLSLSIIFFVISLNAQGETIKKFNIIGNERVSDETIIMFSNLDVGQNIEQDILNEALKDLYSTNYFKDISAEISGGILTISVKENQIIQAVTIKGINKKNVLESIESVTKKIEKYPFIESMINDQVNLLKNTLKSYGYYFVKLKTSIVENENNSVDLIYNFDLGPIAEIKNIKFIGNKVFRDNTLRNVIISEETKFWKFITKNKFLNTSRINIDVSRLEKFYKNRGFFNVKIKSTTAVINNDDEFDLIFNINSGNKFYFNEVIIENKKDLPFGNFEKYQKRFDKLSGKKYSEKKINDLISDINFFTLRNDFVFVNADYKEIVKPDNKIDILINFDELEKVFVDRINILGNFITDEKVIRNSLIVDEGDPYNDVLFKKSIQNLKSRNIFKTIDYKITSKNNLYKVIDINVEEKATGEIFAGAGTGTAGSSISAGIKENNYLGLGIKLDTNLTINDDSVRGKFSVLNPNYNNSDKSLRTTIESSTTDLISSSGYKTSRTGIMLGTEFEQMTDLFVNLELSNYYEDLETSSTANSIVKKQEGNYFENLITYSISYNKLNQNFQPSDGFISKFSQTLPLYSDDLSFENKFTISSYHSISDNLILSAKFYLSAINSLEDNVRVSKRVYVPSARLRGFESGKIGPKDGLQYIGGNYASSLNLSSTLPNLIFENEDVDFNIFMDFANVWKVDYDSSLDSNKIRSSSGLAVNWFSPIGPLTFSYAIPLSEASTDITENFRFQIGTSF